MSQKNPGPVRRVWSHAWSSLANIAEAADVSSANLVKLSELGGKHVDNWIAEAEIDLIAFEESKKSDT